MSRKRILTITSRKKRNGMLSWTNTTPAGSLTTPSASNYNVRGDVGGRSLWLATAMDLSSSPTSNNTIAQQAARTATTCYMVGLSEHIRIQTNSNVPWFWRRICFTVRGSEFLTAFGTDTFSPYVETSNGMQRLFRNMLLESNSQTIDAQDSILFKGVRGVDWTDQIIAPVDTGRVTVKFDKTWTLKSGNESGTVVERKLWHPMKQNLVYGDDENGEREDTSFFSSRSKAGMGDYFVMDFISGGALANASSVLLLQSNATLYWHEK